MHAMELEFVMVAEVMVGLMTVKIFNAHRGLSLCEYIHAFRRNKYKEELFNKMLMAVR